MLIAGEKVDRVVDGNSQADCKSTGAGNVESWVPKQADAAGDDQGEKVRDDRDQTQTK